MGPWKVYWELVKRASSSWKTIAVFFILLIAGGFLSARWFDTSSILSGTRINIFTSFFSPRLPPPHPPATIHIICPRNTQESPKCPSSKPHNLRANPSSLPYSCPPHFRYIYEDLRPWHSTGITKETLEAAKKEASFRLVVIDGQAYFEKYKHAWQTRDVFTLWGVLQLLNQYPGRVRDFDMMFLCDDLPVIQAADYIGKKVPPPLFRYCKDDTSLEIVFPDWSFWGWPEAKIKPWVKLKEEIREGNNRTKWKDRDPNAYWKGNPLMGQTRQDLMKCNVTNDTDWNARLFFQDWPKETANGFKTSDLAGQCTYRFNIYIEEVTWPVSEKYILACDSPTLFVNSRFQDFFSRGLIPGKHYLPIADNNQCRSIKAAVDWGNSHQDQAQAIGKVGSSFVQEELNMDYVYDYMLHLLNEYSMLLKYKPSIPENAVKVCLESMACQAHGRVKEFMVESMVRSPRDSEPCVMPQPFSANELKDLLKRKTDNIAEAKKLIGSVLTGSRTNNFTSSPPQPPPPATFHLYCPQNLTESPKCPPSKGSISTVIPQPISHSSIPPFCPSYFRWIHEDLRPWSSTGITKEIVETAKDKDAEFRLVVIDGRAYLEQYHDIKNSRFGQSRGVPTLWGLLQLLNRYPGRVRDFDIIFNLEDRPTVRAADYEGKKLPPPPLFRYCKDDATVDIVFPDWSFWGWPEINIKPWVTLLEKIKEGNKRTKWKDRDPYAYWKGNPWVAPTRRDFITCNVSKDRDWNARLFIQNWDKEAQEGFRTSDLSSQCTHRFKIYIEGWAWSVSEKYILACDSPTLFINTPFQDFVNRGLMPGQHYIPIRDNDKCRSIEAAVNWGNSHQDQAQAIGKAGSRFIQEELSMDFVYDYMFHLLNEYSKLLKYKPSIPENAVELCLESLACQAQGRAKDFMLESMVRSPHDSDPCVMPQPFSPNELAELRKWKADSTANAEKVMESGNGTTIFTSLFNSPQQQQQPPPATYHLHCPQNLTAPICTSKPWISTINPSPISPPTPPPLPPSSCPSYFRWIHEDLRPWRSTGITKEILESAKNEGSSFRLVVIDGRAYMDQYRGFWQSRGTLTLWGILQMLKRYPGKVRDFDIIFNLEDMPTVRAAKYKSMKQTPPPLFRYCKDDSTVDIVFPDWSFWGWPEINIKPWITLAEEINEANKRTKWKDRDPHAYWKGNPWVAGTRQDLMKCNVSKHRDWNARLFAQNWNEEVRKGFKTSDLASQCTHRYKIYVEGRAWSVSEKYILACDSPTLFINTRFHDFFNRGLMPGQHYIPIRDNNKCRSIKAAVDWGNSHQDQAQAIGKAGSSFIQEEVNMDSVYEYMFHLLNEYSKLLRYKPTVPEKAVELCVESMACQAKGKLKEHMMLSMVKNPSDSEPCVMPQPFTENELKEFLKKKADSRAKMENRE